MRFLVAVLVVLVAPAIAVTYGRYVARMKGGDPDRQQFDLWFERIK
jgi:hypothetical protein